MVNWGIDPGDDGLVHGWTLTQLWRGHPRGRKAMGAAWQPMYVCMYVRTCPGSEGREIGDVLTKLRLGLNLGHVRTSGRL